jgi:hypothetical protein
MGQPVEKLPLRPLRPQIGPQTHRIWALLELLEPDSRSLSAQLRLFQQAGVKDEVRQASFPSGPWRLPEPRLRTWVGT